MDEPKSIPELMQEMADFERPSPEDWIAEFLNRRTAVERILRAPFKARKFAEVHGHPEPEFRPMSIDEMWELANTLSVPAGFGYAFHVGQQVVKPHGYPFPGEVRAAFSTISGEQRFVVEATGPAYLGMLHIFNGTQLRKEQS